MALVRVEQGMFHDLDATGVLSARTPFTQRVCDKKARAAADGHGFTRNSLADFNLLQDNCRPVYWQ